nr:DUF6252 family protein [uncultured Flavobacterium sp.]
MRRFFSIIVLLFVLASCEDQVKFNNPAVQGLKDNLIWRGTLFTAVQSTDGSLTIEAYQKNEILTLKTSGTSVQTYPLGINLINKAILTEKVGDTKTVFSTGTNSSNGQIVITELDVVNHTITGEFKFNANLISSNALTVQTVNFQKGVFYKVPITIDTKLQY